MMAPHMFSTACYTNVTQCNLNHQAAKDPTDKQTHTLIHSSDAHLNVLFDIFSSTHQALNLFRYTQSKENHCR